jgi:hypothetical protein
MFISLSRALLMSMLSGMKNKFSPSPEVTSVSGCAFLTRHYWKLVKPWSSWQESFDGSVTATTIKIPPEPCCSDTITLPITQRLPHIQITCMLAIELSLALIPQSSRCYNWIAQTVPSRIPGALPGRKHGYMEEQTPSGLLHQQPAALRCPAAGELHARDRGGAGTGAVRASSHTARAEAAV